MQLSPELALVSEKIYYKTLQNFKWVYHLARFKGHPPKTILFVVGCQRSGTTLINQIFEKDLNTKVYAEVSSLSSNDIPYRLRLNPLDSVKAALDRDLAPLVILKPLVESQNILQLLTYFEGAKAVWVYRHYKDVAASYVKKWGPHHSINDLRAILAQQPHDWRCERISADVDQVVRRYFSEDMPPHDASALYWFIRNSFFFDLNLANNPRVFLCSYKKLVLNPVEVMTNIYKFLGCQFPGDRIVSMVHPASVNKGRRVELSPPIEELCQQLLDRFDRLQANTKTAPPPRQKETYGYRS